MAIPLLEWLALPACNVANYHNNHLAFSCGRKRSRATRNEPLALSLIVFAFLLAVRFTETPQGFVAVEALLFALLVSNRKPGCFSSSCWYEAFEPSLIIITTHSRVWPFTAGVVIVLAKWLDGMVSYGLLNVQIKGEQSFYIAIGYVDMVHSIAGI